MTDDTSMASTLTFSQFQTICRIYPLVPATILHYTIRNPEGPIAGMLLGVREGNIVSIRNCYPVLLRYSEDKEGGEEDQTVGIDMEYCSRMYKLYSKISPHEQIVGWFSTFPHLDSVLLSLHQVLASRYYKTAETPFVYLALDPSLKENKQLLIKTYCVPTSYMIFRSAFCFMELSHNILKDNDTGMNAVMYGQKYKDPLSLIMHDMEQETYKSEEIKEEESILGNTELIRNSLQELHKLLEKSEGYAQKVVEGKEAEKWEIGVMLHNSLGKLRDFDKHEMLKLCKEHDEEIGVLTTLESVIRSQILLTEQLSKH